MLIDELIGTPMNCNKAKTATDIVTIPRKFHMGDMSVFALLKATGYFELHDQVSVSDIREARIRDPACVQEWMQYVDDLRCPSSWYFGSVDDENQYEVGFFDIKANPNRSHRVQYQNATNACAAYIKHEIESIRSHVIEDIQKHEQTVKRKRALNRAKDDQ